jgi:hypothetical protein
LRTTTVLARGLTGSGVKPLVERFNLKALFDLSGNDNERNDPVVPDTIASAESDRRISAESRSIGLAMLLLKARDQHGLARS